MISRKSVRQTYLYTLERVAHHGNEHVDKDDDDGDVVQCKQEHSDSFHDRRGVISARKTVRVFVVLVFARVFDLDAVNTH